MKIAWVCPKPGAPSGGVWFIHRLAGLAETLGHESWIAQTEPFDVWWDAHPYRRGVVRLTQSGIPDDAVAIIPEGLWHTHRVPALDKFKAVCFMQNHIWLNKEFFRQYPGPLVTCSRFMSNYARDVLGVKPIGKLTPYLDDDVWRADVPDKKSVLIMGRRSSVGARLRDELLADGYQVTYIDQPLTQRDLAVRLRQHQYYTHLPYPEGFPMAALEAMRSCVAVVGTTGGGGNEFMFHKQTAYVTPDPDAGLYNDDGEYVRRIHAGLNWLEDNPGERAQMVTRAYGWSMHYNVLATRHELSELIANLEKLYA